MSRARETLLVALLFAALTVIMTWPQAAVMSTRTSAHFDAYFSIWRIAWIARQLPSEPWNLFHANIFHPQRFTLALSDPVLLQGLAAAPLLWLGVSPVFVYNTLVLASFVLCGTAAWALAARLSGSSLAGVVGGIVFAFAPYRYEHYFHLEILWGFWIPLALLALHRAVDCATVAAGVRVGLVVIAQALSCLYYAVYLAVALAVAAPLLVRWRESRRRRTVAGLGAGALVAIAFAVVYLQPLLAIREELLPRGMAETHGYSATAASYLATPAGNRTYGRLLGPLGAGELRLFPGIAAVVLAIGAFRRPQRTTLAYTAVLAVAVIGSFGTHAPLFWLARGASELMSMLRVPARFAAIALCALAVLAAIGAAAFFTTLRSARARALGAVVIAAVMLIEYRTVVDLHPVRTDPAALHRWLARQPRAPVVEFPMPQLARLPGADAYRQYFSTMHWQPLLNGYSGYYPVSYINLLAYVAPFPRGGWIDLVLGRGARYIVLHERDMSRETLAEALRRLEAHPEVRLVARFADAHDPAWVYERVAKP